MHLSSILLTASCLFFSFLRLVQGDDNAGRNILKPLYLPNLDGASLSARAQGFTVLDPRESETLLWGNLINGTSDYMLANMTLYTASSGDQLIISLERFHSMLKSVQCGNTTVLEFVDHDAFQYAIQAWNWVNEHENHHFILIADDPGCGPDDQRVPFYINSVEYDEQHSTVHLHGSEKAWQEVAQTFDLEYGTVSPPPQSNLSKRFGEWGTTKGFSVPLSNNLDGNIFYEHIPSGGTFRLDCTDCGISGSLDVTFKISVSYSKGFLDIPIPAWDFEIPDIGGFATHFKGKIGISLSKTQDAVTIDFGAVAKLQDSAVAKLDLVNPDDEQFHGWLPTFQAKPFHLSNNISADVSVYLQWTLGPQFTLFNQGLEAALVLKLPDFKAAIDGFDSKESVCAQKNEDGTSVDLSVGAALALRAGKRGDLAITADITDQPVFGGSAPLFKRGFEIEGSEQVDTFANEVERKTDVAIRTAGDLDKRFDIGTRIQLTLWAPTLWDLWKSCLFAEPKGSSSTKASSSEHTTSTKEPEHSTTTEPTKPSTTAKEPPEHSTATTAEPEKPTTTTKAPPEDSTTPPSTPTPPFPNTTKPEKPSTSTKAPPEHSSTPPPTTPTDPAKPTAIPSGSGPKDCKIIGNLLNHRLCPSTSCTSMGEYPAGTIVSFVCRTTGEEINGNSYWDKNTKGEYVSEYYVDSSCAVRMHDLPNNHCRESSSLLARGINRG
ncbi:hypothetical protein T310_3864 [Rasamsonia emersonii CBS 393.64]|uniref:Uncharacterized protein n=1 Tax=Rasamsonia emersonii (strain ATCC 16479 / CBS 393.64 / IMI 116815) TaxID=1408163 RepID=A0A0F4YV79_RASE3|nr:hypothetical protein T310_3864 [Rasamsonia emersonii CBS 393.64]KKA22124.1 hypothetical protein T310_3864 [Rasamsonia emersonii CBS 393.64]